MYGRIIPLGDFILNYEPKFIELHNDLDNEYNRLIVEYNNLLYRYNVLKYHLLNQSEIYPSLLEGNAYTQKNENKLRNLGNGNFRKVSQFGSIRKPRKKSLTDAQIEKVVNEYMSGVNRNQLAIKYKVSWESINRYVSVFGTMKAKRSGT